MPPYALCRTDPEPDARQEILITTHGTGEATARTMLVETPELGTVENKWVASLADLAPVARDPRQFRGKRFMRGGCAQLRQTLSIPALVGIRVYANMTAR